MVAARIAVLGGDAREWHAACALRQRGFDVVYVGTVPARGFWIPGDPPARASLEEAVPGARVVVGPVRGLPPEGEEALAWLLESGRARPAVCVMGRPGPRLRAACRSAGTVLEDILLREDFMVANAVPTAEGAIVEALLASEVTLARSRAAVLGYGRTGRALAQRLLAWGADTWVVARRAASRAEAEAAGARAAGWEELEQVLAGAHLVFNTVPERVLDEVRLRACRPGTVVVDIASPPGGVDHEAAARLGLTVRWPLGIPGRYAPRSAGLILAGAVQEILRERGLLAPSLLQPQGVG